MENPLEPAFADSGASPAWVLGRSDESFEDLPLLRLEVSIASDSAETVQARRDLPPLRLEDSESAMDSRGQDYPETKDRNGGGSQHRARKTEALHGAMSH